jgi:hypothetical protein
MMSYIVRIVGEDTYGAFFDDRDDAEVEVASLLAQGYLAYIEECSTEELY